MNTKTVQMRIVAGFLASASLVACGGEGGGGEAGGDGEVPATATVGFSDRVSTLDPILASNIPDVSVLHLIGGNLYRLLPDGSSVPGLASKGVQSKDGMTWTFTLQPDLTFSDGTLLTSADVVATLSRALTDKANVFATLFDPIDSVEEDGPGTVVFNLNRPYPSLPTVLAEPVGTILPLNAFEDPEEFFLEPISSGPYEITSWNQSSTIVLSRNDDYWGPKAAIEELKFETVPDANGRLAQTQSGGLSLGVDLPPSTIPGMTPAEPQITKTFGFFALTTNTKAAPISDVKVRRAISLALNRSAIVDSVWHGRTDPLAGFWPSAMEGYDSEISTEQDIDAAKDELDGTECSEGCSVSLMYTEGYSWEPPTALIIQDNLREIGIDVTLEKVESTDYYNRLGTGDYQLSLNGLYDYVNIPDGMLAYGLSPDFNTYYSGYQSQTIAEAMTEASLREGTRRETALARINELFVEEAPYVTLADQIWVNASSVSPDLISFGPAGLVNVAPGL